MAILRKPTEVYPDNARNDPAVDSTDSSVDFTIKIDGDVCVRYILRIYILSTRTLTYTDDTTLTPSQYVRDGETLTMPVDFTVAGLGANDYYWQADLYYDGSNFITTFTYPFSANTPPTITINPTVPATITNQSYEFVGDYSQAENVEVESFTITLYDSSGNEIESSNDERGDPTYSSNIKHTFNGFLNATSYGVEISGTNVNNVTFSTGIITFSVAYTAPTATTPSPTATLNDDSSVFVDWGSIVYILGTTTGTTSYTADFNTPGNYGLALSSGARVDFDVSVPSVFTVHSVFKPTASSFTGDMMRITNTTSSQFIAMGYDGSRFYINVNGTFDYDIPETLTTNNYIIAIRSDGTSITQYHREVT